MLSNGVDKSRIHWLCWQPTPYNDFLFQRLANEPGFLLTVHYRERVVSSHPWRSPLGHGYDARYYRRLLGVDWRILGLALRESESLFVVGGWDHLTAVFLLTALRLLRRHYTIWTDTPNLIRRRHLIKTWLRAKWLRWIFRGAVKVMGTGRPGVQALCRMGAPSEKVINLPFFQDTTLYRIKRDAGGDAAGRPIRFLSVGRIEKSAKGHDVAVRAFAQVAKGSDARLWLYRIAGTGPDEASIRQLARELGVKDRVCILGWVEPGELVELYRESDALIHPSPVHDPFPNAVLEAMAAGLVVLTSDVTGAGLDRIQHGVNGFLHKAGDAEELAGQISRLLQQPERIPEIGRRARATAEEWPVERGIAAIREMLASCAVS
jgi:glycosyltransferase involved in cell wall biosynthesis